MQSIIPGTKIVLASLLLSTFKPTMYNPSGIRFRTQEVETLQLGILKREKNRHNPEHAWK